MNIQYYADDGTIKNLGDDELQHWKYIKKIKTGSGWRYFYSPEELRQFYNEGKKKVDSIPRLQKHGDKYYIADKKTQKKIEKSGAGGNDYYVDKKAYKKRSKEGNEPLRKLGVNPKTLSTDRSILEFNAKETNRIRDEKEKYDIGYRYGNELSKSLYRAKSLAKQKSYEGAAKGQTKKYEQYEAKNVTNRKISEIKNKTSKGKSAVKKKLNKAKKTVKNEVKGVKRASNALSKNGKVEGVYEGNGAKKFYPMKYDKKKRLYTSSGKAKKTGKIERRMINSYRKRHPYE